MAGDAAAGGAGPLDRQIYEALYAGDRPALLAVARFFTALGEPTVLIGAGVVVAAWLFYSRAPASAVGADRDRHDRAGLKRVRRNTGSRGSGPTLEPHLVMVKTSSFPSGHATSSMIFFLTLALVLTAGTRWQRPAAVGAILLSLAIGTSRVMLGVHWPSDVIGGWAFGLLWVLLTLRLAGRLVQA